MYIYYWSRKNWGGVFKKKMEWIEWRLVRKANRSKVYVRQWAIKQDIFAWESVCVFSTQTCCGKPNFSPFIKIFYHWDMLLSIYLKFFFHNFNLVYTFQQQKLWWQTSVQVSEHTVEFCTILNCFKRNFFFSRLK